MANLFHVSIVTPNRTIYDGEAVSLVVPAELGYLGILANHAPLVAHLIRGNIILRDNTGEARIFRLETQGFIEVLKNKASLILDSVTNA